MSINDQIRDRLEGRPATRREALKWGAAAGSVLLLGACGSGTSGSSTATAGSAVTGRRGGTLRVGLAAGGENDTLNPFYQAGAADGARYFQLFDQFLTYDADNNIAPATAEEFIPNKRGDEWTVRMREGVEFHNGKTVSAEDVIATIRYGIKDGRGPVFIVGTQIIDLPASKILDKRTVRFKLRRPFSVLDELFAAPNNIPLVSVDFDARKAIGTGPFKLKSFVPGRQSVFTRWEGYYGGAPFIDELVMSDLTDNTARVNALLGGQVDMIASVPFANVPELEGNPSVHVAKAPSGLIYPFGMNTKTAPFDDVRVRRAMRLLADRPQLVASALSGHGRVGNDLYAIDDKQNYDASLPQRVQDVEQAKSLLRAAGRLDDTFVLNAGPLGAGAQEAAQIFAQQASAAGVKVKAQNADIATWASNFPTWPFKNTYWPGFRFPALLALSDGPSAPYSDTYFGDTDAKFRAVCEELYRTTDRARRTELAHQAQALQYEDGAYVVWGFVDMLDAISTKVTGYVTDPTGYSFGRYDFRKVSVT